MSPSASTRSAEPSTFLSFGRGPRPILVLVATLLLALLALAPLASAQSAGDALGVPIDLYVDGSAAGTIEASISGGAVSLDRARLAEILSPVLDETVLSLLRSTRLSAGRGTIGLSELTALGFGVAFDPSLLRVTIHLPAEARRAQRLPVSGTAFPASLPERPAVFSAAVNLRARADLRFGPVAALPLGFDLQPWLNWRGWVLETDLSVSEDGGWAAVLETARLVRDFPGISGRLALGSLFLPVTGFQAAPTSAGVEFTHLPATYRPEGPLVSVDESLIVSSSALVDILLNGKTIASRALQPGRYEIPDIPFVTGINTLVIESLRRIVPFDSRLLPNGEAAFSVSLGVPQWTLGSPMVSGFILYGLSPFVSTGVDLQAGLDRQLGGVQALLATPAGNLRALAGVSLSAQAGADFSALLEYRLAFPASAWLPTLGLSARYTGRSFLGPGDPRTENPYRWLLSGSLSQALPLGIGMNIGLGWEEGWGTVPDATTATLTLSRPVGSGTSLAVLVTAQFTSGASPEVRTLLALSSAAPGSDSSAGTAAKLNGGAASVDVHARPFPSGNAPSFSASLSGLPTDANGASGSFGAAYAGSILETGLSDSFSPGANTLSLELGTAIVTAGGAVGLSRPVADSFAIVIPRENMSSQRVVVNAGEGEREAVADRGKPAVLSWLQAYAPTAITVEAPLAPPGVDAGDYLRTLAPTYRSGVVVRVGTRATIYVEGILLAADGTPVAYRAGQARPADDPKTQPIAFFTDGSGLFQIYGLTAGAWDLSFAGDPPYTMSVAVPGDVEGLYDLGSFRLPDPQRKG